MLLQVFINVGSEILARVLQVFRRPGYGIEFVVTHHSQCLSILYHVAGNFDRFDLLWAAVNEVPEEDHLSTGMLPNAIGLLIVKFYEQGFQFSGVAVDIADQVIHLT